MIKLNKKEVLKQYRNQVLFQPRITLEDIEQYLPENMEIHATQAPVLLHLISKGLNAGLMIEPNAVIKVAVSEAFANLSKLRCPMCDKQRSESTNKGGA